ncbi:uncharacterized protein CXorf66 homolog [Crocuta crocuta]
MNLCVYVLLLFVWANSCLDTNRSDGSPTTGAKHFETMDTKLESLRRRLLVITIGIMIIAFASICFCFIYYNCSADEAPKAGTLKKEGVTAPAARPPSKMSFSDSKTPNPCSREQPSLLSSTHKLSSVSSPEKSSIPSSAERLIRPSSPQHQSLSPGIPKANKPSSGGRKRPSCSDKKFQSFHLEKSYRTRHLGKPYQPVRAHRPVGQAASSNPKKAVSPPWPVDVQYVVMPIQSLCPLHPQNHISSPKPSTVQTLTKSLRHRKLKRSVCGRRADMLFRPQLIKACRCYKRKCLVRRSSEPLFNSISEAKNRNAQNPLFTNEGKPFTQPFLKADYRDNVFCATANNSDVLTYENDGSDREVTILCNVTGNETIPEGIQDN